MATQLMKDWIVELHNPERKQATGGLGYLHEDGSSSNCCLGVLCEVAGIQGETMLDEPHFTTSDRETLIYRGRESMPPSEVIDQVMGNEMPGGDESVVLFEDDTDDEVWAESANDDLGLSFREIAARLEDKYLTTEEQFEVRKRIEDKGWA